MILTKIEKWEERKIFKLEKGKYSNKRKGNIPIRKRKIFQIDKGKHSNQKKEIIPIRKKIQLEKGDCSN